MVLNSLGDLLTKRCATRVFAKQKEIKMDPKDHSIPATAATNCYLGGRVHREGQTLAAGVPTSMLCLTGLTWLIPPFPTFGMGTFAKVKKRFSELQDLSRKLFSHVPFLLLLGSVLGAI